MARPWSWHQCRSECGLWNVRVRSNQNSSQSNGMQKVTGRSNHRFISGQTLLFGRLYLFSKNCRKSYSSKRNENVEKMVPKQYWEFAKVFFKEESQRLPQHQPWDHAIDLEPGAVQKWKIKLYPMSPNEQLELDKFLTEHIQKGYLVPSKSLIGSPVFFIKKKDGKLQLVQDYRRLNKITIKNWYPLPLAADIINQLTKALYFTKFDIHWGYHNIHICKGEEWKGVIVTNRGLHKPKVMYFGMTNSPATFQALMNSVFTDLIAKEK